MRNVWIILFLLCSSPLWANSVDAQIEAIQKAPVSERFKLMNALKKKLVKMKEKERLEALAKLRTSTKSRKAQKSISSLEERSRSIKRQHLENEMDNHIDNEIENQIQDNNEENGGGNDD